MVKAEGYVLRIAGKGLKSWTNNKYFWKIEFGDSFIGYGVIERVHGKA
ncbi:MAG: hypothetical protein QXZ47_03680 [Candidatus Bathyarchaeia archaeon]